MIWENIFGPNHADTATGINSLALIYQTLGQHDKALPMYQHALAIREKALGPDHADTATNFSNLASLHTALEQYDQALSFQKRALDIRENNPGNPETGG